MPFAAHCASAALHGQWGCPSNTLPLSSKVRQTTKTKLLELVGKNEARDFHLKPPKFCTFCIGKVSELYPDQEQSDSSQVAGPSESLATSDSAFEIDNEMQVTDVVQDAQLATSSSSISMEDMPMIHQAELIIGVNTAKSDNEIDIGNMTESERCELAYQLGKFQYESAKKYALLASTKDIDDLLTLDVRSHIDKSCTTAYSFICGMSGSSLITFDDEGQGHITYKEYKAIESILDLSSMNLSLPCHFRESALIYALTGSKLALQILGTGGPHASYKSVKTWLNRLGSSPNNVEDNDVVIAFDNNQVIQRRWKVRLRNEVKCHIVTIVVSFSLNTDSHLQFSADYKPKQWMSEILSDDQINHIKFIDQDDDVKLLHYNHLYSFIESELQTVINEQSFDEQDHIDKQVEAIRRAKLYKKCYNCNFDEIPKTKHTCPSCKVSLTKSRMKEMGLDDVGNPIAESKDTKSPSVEYRVLVKQSSAKRSQHSLFYSKLDDASDKSQNTGSIKANVKGVKVLEPVYVNPCGYDAVCMVLRNIGQRCGIKQYGGSREWVLVVCDGIPYTLCSRLIRSMHLCLVCSNSFKGLEEATKHINLTHPDVDSPSLKLEFDWVLLQPGVGHIEMNMIKGVVELGWDVFWRQLAYDMNFRSETALQYAKKVSDHHKGWTLARVARHAIAREMMVPFVKLEMAKDERDRDMTASAFLKFAMMASNPNYTFMADFTFELLDSIFLFRVGVRYGNYEMVRAGRAKFAKLWCGRNHPLYRELELSDMTQFARMPTEVKSFVSSYTSLLYHNQDPKGEGADFRLEEVNKLIQQWLPNIPSTIDWKIACSNFGQLSKLREVIFKQMDVKDPKTRDHKYVQDIDDEINAFRTTIRKSGYLSEPNAQKDHVSLDGKKLDVDLHKFCVLARQNRIDYVDAFLTHEHSARLHKPSPPAFHVKPVFIDDAERVSHTAVENLTIREIKEIVESKMDSVSDETVREALMETWMEIKGHKKEVLLEFYQELEEYVSQDIATSLYELSTTNEVNQ